jgi:hypothetical protein
LPIQYLKTVLTVATLLLLTLSSSAEAQREQLTNDDVLRMVEAGLGAETIIAAINSSEPNFDVSVDDLITLKAAGVSDDIIRAMLTSVKNAEEVSSESADPDGGEFPAMNGVYAVADEGYVLLEEEPIEGKSGGIFNSGVTRSGGTTRTSRHARLNALHSPLELYGVRELLLVCHSCPSAYDFHILRANDEDDKREFHVSFRLLEDRQPTGWVIRGGEDDKTIKFEGTRVADGTFLLVLPQLIEGEYAVLPPDASPANETTSLLYSFRVVAQ